MYRRAQGLAAPLLAVQVLIVGLALPWRQLGAVTTALILAAAALAILQAIATLRMGPRRDPPAIEDLPTPETDRPSRAEDQGAPEALQRSRRQAAEALDALCGSGEDGPGGTAPATEALGKTADELSRAAMRVSTEATSASVAAEDVRHDLAAVMEASREFFDTISQIGTYAASSAAMGVSAFGKAEATSTNVDELLVASQRIGEMTGLVASIARQTNLLALNATIEAARAGEHGRGFAVVAAEVKALAGESAKAASSIADMATLIYGTTERAIGSIQAIAAAIGGLNEATNAIATAVEERVHAAASMTGSVERVTANIDHVANAVARIETAADETLQGAGLIRRRATDVEAQSAAIEARVGLCADLLAPLAAADRSPQAADPSRDPVSPAALALQLPRGFR